MDMSNTGDAAGKGVITRFVDRISQPLPTLRAQAPLLPDYALHYFDSLKAKFETLHEPAQNDAVACKAYRDAQRIVQTPRLVLTWSDLMLLDLLIARSLDFAALRLKIADLRLKLDGAAPALADGLVPKLDNAKPGDMEALRAAAEALITRVWHLRMSRNARDRYVGELRGTIFTSLMWLVVGFWLFTIVVVGWTPLYFVIIIAGMLGALTSFLRRLQKVADAPPNPDQSTDLSALAYEKRSAVMSLAIGGVFALVLYVLFAAGMGNLMGDMGPQFEAPKHYALGGVDFHVFVNLVGPATGPDYAKVVVWSFIAGFFEQFVPDVLDRVANKK